MAREQPQINLRISKELKDRLEASAMNNKRSLTAEVVDRLERSFYEVPLTGATPELIAQVRDEVIKALYNDFTQKTKSDKN